MGFFFYLQFQFVFIFLFYFWIRALKKQQILQIWTELLVNVRPPQDLWVFSVSLFTLYIRTTNQEEQDKEQNQWSFQLFTTLSINKAFKSKKENQIYNGRNQKKLMSRQEARYIKKAKERKEEQLLKLLKF